MRGTRFVAAAGVAIIAVVAAVLIWQQQGARWLLPRIAAEIAASTDLRLQTDSLLGAQLFPAPVVRAADVRLTAGGGAPLLHADQIEVRLGWPALWRGTAAITNIRLRHARFFTDAAGPPVEIAVDLASGPAEISLTGAAGGAVTTTAHREGGALVLDHVTVRLADLVASGSGRLTLRDPLRLVLTADLGTAAGAPAGTAAVAASYAADGLVLERASWQLSDGTELAVFGHAAAVSDGLRMEGGVGGSLGGGGDAGDVSARFDGTMNKDGLAIAIDDIEARGPAFKLSGRASFVPGTAARASAELRLDRLDLTRLGTSPMASLMARVGLPAEIEARLRLRLDELLINGRAIGDGVVIDVARHGGILDLRELAARSLGGAPMRASGRLEFAPSAVTVDPLQLAYAEVRAAGRAELNMSGTRPRLVAEVTAGALDLDALFAGPPPLPPEPMTRRAAAAASAAAARQAASAGWSRTPLGLPHVALPIDTELRAAAPRVTWHGYRLDDAKLALDSDDQQLTIRSVTGQAFGGQVALAGVIQPRARPHFSGRLQLAGVDLQQVLMKVADVRDVAGQGDITAEVQADGDTMADLVAAAAGTGSIAARAGTIVGIDVPQLAERLKRMNRPTDLIEVGRLAAGGRTPFSSFTGHFRLDRGVLRTDDLRLDARGASMHTRGTIDLPAWALNLANEFQFEEPPGIPPFVIKVDGSISAPRRVFDINRLQSYLLHRGAGSAAR